MHEARFSTAVDHAGAVVHAGDAEWLLTDGAGGYACGAVDDLVRRRYHGLWIARPAGSTRRHMVLAGLDERLVEGDVVTHFLHAHWRDHERSSPGQAANTFTHGPLPTWTFRTGAHTIERQVALQRAAAGQAPLALVRWRNLGAVSVRLCVRPLLGWCDADHLPTATERFDATVQARGASWGVRPNELLPTLWLTADGTAAFVAEGSWYRGFVYAEDRARGYDHIGDRWSPGVIELDIGPGHAATVAFSLTEPCTDARAAFDLVAASAAQRWRDAARQASPLVARLALTADDFFYRDDSGRLGVLAGFPWFGEWGRDVFVSLPGLTLARGRLDLCADVLRGALPFLRGGLLPNIYGRDAADSHYDSCDAALWFSLAVQRYMDAGGDTAFVQKQLVPALADIARCYQRGTDLGLVVDAAGLLCAGRADLNATWMDARTASGPVTPRAGLPVEIQALWYSLLAFLAEHDPQWAPLRDRCGKAFVQQFWLTNDQCLADRVFAGTPVREVRPNMLVAAALARSPLSLSQRAGVVAKARAELVTSVGLRTLSPLDAAYRGRYGGGIDARDSAYHQGTVWPWLAGFYVEATLAAVSKKARRQTAQELSAWLDGFVPELERAGLDHVSEVFDGDPPHRPGGTFAQAWNSGELLRAGALVAGAQQ